MGVTLNERISNGARTGDEMTSVDANLVIENLFTNNLDFSFKVASLTDETIRYPTINNRAFDKGTISLDRHVLTTLEYAL